MAAYNATNIANAVPKIFSKDALAVFNSTRVFSKLFKDVSSKMTLGGNTYQQTTYTDIGSANTKTAGSSITLDSATLGKVDLVINTWVEKSFAIEADILEDINASIPFIQDTIEMCSIKCAEALEKSIGALFGTFTTKVGNSSSALDIDTLLAIEGEEDNIIEDGKAKVDKWLTLAKKFGTKCTVVEDDKENSEA